MLKTRIITACILVAVFIPTLFMLSNISWAYCMLALSLLALYEWGGMIKLNPLQKIIYLIVAAVAGLFALFLLRQHGFHFFFFKSLMLFAVVALFWLLIVPFWFKTKHVVKSKSILAVLGLLLIASLWLALICAKGADPWLLLILLITIWIADSAAYFAGKNFGKHKLAPNISPGKTWEGVLGALIAVSLFAAILYSIDLDGAHLAGTSLGSNFGFNQVAIFPLLWAVTCLGVAGDLFESLMKRHANLKDSSNLLPGHGGILDRIDGIIPSLPIALLMIYVYHYFNSVT